MSAASLRNLDCQLHGGEQCGHSCRIKGKMRSCWRWCFCLRLVRALLVSILGFLGLSLEGRVSNWASGTAWRLYKLRASPSCPARAPRIREVGLVRHSPPALSFDPVSAEEYQGATTLDWHRKRNSSLLSHAVISGSSFWPSLSPSPK